MHAVARFSVAIMVSGLCTAAAPGIAATCVPPAHQASTGAMTAFMGAPSSLLNQSGGKLATSVRNLAVTSAAAVELMPKLAAGATPDQLGALGAGLGQAALVCRRTAPDMALAIQKSVIGSNQPAVVTAYEAVTQEQLTAAVAPDAPAAPPGLDVSGDAIEGGGAFPNSNTSRAGGVLPLTSYYATPTVLATGLGSSAVSRFVVNPTTSVQTTSTTLLAPPTGATQSVSPSR